DRQGSEALERRLDALPAGLPAEGVDGRRGRDEEPVEDARDGVSLSRPAAKRCCFRRAEGVGDRCRRLVLVGRLVEERPVGQERGPRREREDLRAKPGSGGQPLRPNVEELVTTSRTKKG